VEKIEIDGDDPTEVLTGNEAPEAADTPSPPEPDPVSTAVRLVVGTASLGLEAFRSRLRAWGQEPGDVSPTPSDEAGTVGDAMVGGAARGVRAAASLGVRGAELAREGLRAVGGTTRAFRFVVPDFLQEPMDRARDRARERIRRLEVAGREELERSRAVARDALDEGLDAIIGRLADSRELQLVIRTQSVTAGEEAVGAVRDQAARIDDRLEGTARRILRRRPRPTSPPS
jgi:hypothetical protein